VSEAYDLYQQVILDHNRAPRNYRDLPSADRKAEGQNPLCGDEVTVYLALEGEVIKDVAFQGRGCAISKASASLMTSVVKGKTRTEAEALFHDFRGMVTRKPGEPAPDAAKVGRLAVFAGVAEFPARVKCASLAWHTLHSALTEGRKVSTE